MKILSLAVDSGHQKKLQRFVLNCENISVSSRSTVDNKPIAKLTVQEGLTLIGDYRGNLELNFFLVISLSSHAIKV